MNESEHPPKDGRPPTEGPTDLRAFQHQWSAAFAPREPGAAGSAFPAFIPRPQPRENADHGTPSTQLQPRATAQAGPGVGYADRDAEGADPRSAEFEFRRALFALTPRILVTPALVALNVIVFAVMLANKVSPTNPGVGVLQHWGANFGPLTVLYDQWWRLLTCTFLHIGLMHIFMNMFILCLAGPFVERLLGHTGFLIAYLVAGLTGSLASVWWNPLVTSAGASGAIFGLYGAMIGFVALRRDSIPRASLLGLLRGALVFVAYNIAFGMVANSHVDNSAHVGGLLGGLLVGLVLSQPLALATGLARRRARNLLAAGVGLAVVAGGAAYVRQRPNFQTQIEWMLYVDDVADASIKHRMPGLQGSAALAQALEEYVLPPWRRVESQLAATNESRLPPPQARLLPLLRQYAELRRDQWSLFADSLRQTDPIKRRQERAAAEEKELAAGALGMHLLEQSVEMRREGNQSPPATTPPGDGEAQPTPELSPDHKANEGNDRGNAVEAPANSPPAVPRRKPLPRA